MFSRKPDIPQVRYAVVGLGWIAQEAVLPAFANAENAALTALVSDDPRKLDELGRKYGVANLYSYERYDECLKSGLIDAVYIALPNHLHADFSIRASEAGIHVLCEKPLAVNVQEAESMIEAAARSGTQLMTAYRLHFEEANLMASEIINAGTIGDARLMTALNVQNVETGNIRLQKETGGGPLGDLGIYCINAARYLFHAEPVEVSAFAESSLNPRFDEVPEMVTAIMRFPGNRLAQFTCGFGEGKVSTYRVVGTLGDLLLDPAFTFSGDIKHILTVDEKSKETVYMARDHFAPLLIRFAQYILDGEPCEPSGEEGLTDMKIIEAMQRSIETGVAVKLDLPHRTYRPSTLQNIERRAVRKPELVHAEPPAPDGK